jgi:hypothetical protein
MSHKTRIFSRNPTGNLKNFAVCFTVLFFVRMLYLNTVKDGKSLDAVDNEFFTCKSFVEF